MIRLGYHCQVTDENHLGFRERPLPSIKFSVCRNKARDSKMHIVKHFMTEIIDP